MSIIPPLKKERKKVIDELYLVKYYGKKLIPYYPEITRVHIIITQERSGCQETAAGMQSLGFSQFRVCLRTDGDLCGPQFPQLQNEGVGPEGF